MSTCNRMRTAVVLSALLLAFGLLLAVLAQGVPFVVSLAQIALFLVLAAVLVLALLSELFHGRWDRLPYLAPSSSSYWESLAAHSCQSMLCQKQFS